MIKNILELLSVAPDETENIKIAKGKYKYPETFKETFKYLKEWQKK